LGCFAPTAGTCFPALDRTPAAASWRAPDQDLLHLGGAFVDLADAHVAVDALDREVADVAVAAEDLDGRRAHALGHLAGEELGHRRFLQAGAAGVLQAGGVPDQLARGLDLRGACRPA
jgi:hypothetical protein